MKLYNLKIKDMASVENLTKALLLNGYEIQVSSVEKELPHCGIDHFKVCVFDTQAEKGGGQG